ncbi:nitronate monooxygenase [Pseudovibrio sp. Tun.PSC04-5.I4]|uniref:NAD(P)H-dependent flavin oxidoreductase n=1 Tax=Pseudovibrio sp. Tun.PSC04-5.I4 TaxID=1798213 RepID=UPI000886BAA9|nr:nitronate monooxygenase [Pseudovibrio sp. Tun.PSC04-5.I4]SDQ31569.1 nitronate monooxygenase [Pseudovibrio sp. Tun.PSC04-5.I4]
MRLNSKLLDLLGIELPIIQAPMAAASDSKMAVAVAKAGGLGSLPCAMLGIDKMRAEIEAFREQTDKPLNVNFFCHIPPTPDPLRVNTWKQHLLPYYEELGLDHNAAATAVDRLPFNEAMCEVVEDLKPEIVSFHFGVPSEALLDRVKASGAVILGCATTVKEACFLEAKGCDAIIAQGYEAGGHRSMFLTDDIATQTSTFALVPQTVDAVNVPVIATGGIADGRGVAAAFLLGATAVQIGTAYLLTPESLISDLHRAALKTTSVDNTAITNVFSGRPARGIMNRMMRENGPVSDIAPAFPRAGDALAPLKAGAETKGSTDFSSLWAGQAGALSIEIGAHALTQKLANDAVQRLKSMVDA